MRAGLNLVPVSFTGESEGVAVDNVGVSGVPVELILPEERQQAMDRVKAALPGARRHRLHAADSRQWCVNDAAAPHATPATATATARTRTTFCNIAALRPCHSMQASSRPPFSSSCRMHSMPQQAAR